MGVSQVVNNLLLRLRLQRGLTQEELAEQSGISVRTIRNFERGLVQRPRRSSVDMLLSILDPERKEKLRNTPLDDLNTPRGLAAAWLPLLDPGVRTWRGSRPPPTSLLGRDAAVDLIGEMVVGQPVVIVIGPGGVGKSRVAMAIAEAVSHRFADGVAVAEMGRIPPETALDPAEAMELAQTTVEDLIGPAAAAPGRQTLLVLDNVEHLSRVVVDLVAYLRTRYPATHILVTSRRVPALPGAAIWELPPLETESGVELLMDRTRTSCPTLDLAAERPLAVRLVHRLDGLPRYIEFAAHRLRVLPLSALLRGVDGIGLLGGYDAGALPHQRTLDASLRWDLDLLDERHRRMLNRLAVRSPREAPLRMAEFDVADGEFSDQEAVELLADLADSSLLRVARGPQYEYRMFRHVQALLTDAARWPALNG